MLDQPPDPDSPDGRARYGGTPTWVKVFGVVAVVVLLLIALLLVTGLGGQHGPQRHGASTGFGVQTAAVDVPDDTR